VSIGPSRLANFRPDKKTSEITKRKVVQLSDKVKMLTLRLWFQSKKRQTPLPRAIATDQFTNC
jgi:hypothetical protein